MAIKLQGRASPPVEEASDKEIQDRIDRLLFSGAALVGTWFLAIPGLVLLGKAYRLTKRAQALGRATRPNIITIIGLVCMVDAAANLLLWGIDLFPTHDTVLGKTLYNGIGRLWDGAYYLGYNQSAMGGTSVVSEKSWEVTAVFVMYPMRVIAGYGFLKMKRWGFQYFMVSAWLYVMFWVGYMTQFSHQVSWRFVHTSWGTAGWWLIDILYYTPFLMIPYLHTVNRELWSD